jgi:hypothetical protein
MTIHIALLRSVNVAGQNQVAMAELRRFATDLGLADPRTLLQSGNLVFASTGKTPAALEKLLESQAQQHFDLSFEFFKLVGEDRLPLIPGRDLAGIVERTGAGVSSFHPGDAIFAMLGFDRGSFCAAPRNGRRSSPTIRSSGRRVRIRAICSSWS